MTDQAVILCGGLGTRLGDVAGNLPKPMVEVGGRPVLWHAIARLRHAGFKEVLLAAGYRADVIRQYFDDHDCGIRVEVVAETQPLGTAGGVRSMVDRLASRFAVLYGDVFVDFDVSELLEADARHGAAATLLVRPSDHPWDSDLVTVDERGAVTGFIRASEPREFPRNIANAAVYVVSRDVVRLAPEGTPSDWVKDVFPAALRAGLPLATHAFSGRGFIKDMGTPQRLQAVQAYLRDKQRSDAARGKALPIRAVFLDRDGVINEDVDLIHEPDQLRLLPGVGEAIRRLNERNILVVVATNQPVVARGLCSISELDAIHDRMRNLVAAEGGRIDAIYYCPHHPETHHRDPASVASLRVACDCRKPAPGMLLRATRELGIDLAAAIFAGDRCTDIEAAQRAGMRSLLVGSRSLSECSPDHVFPSLSAMVQGIMEGLLGDVA